MKKKTNAVLIGYSALPGNSIPTNVSRKKWCGPHIKGNLAGIQADFEHMGKLFEQLNISIYASRYSPTKGELLEVLTNLFGRSDESVVYYTGHGRNVDGGWWLEGILKQRTMLEWIFNEKPQDEYILPNEVFDLWQQTRKKGSKLILIIDACYSGYWAHEAKKHPSSASINVVAAANWNETAYDSAGGSAFTVAFFNSQSAGWKHKRIDLFWKTLLYSPVMAVPTYLWAISAAIAESPSTVVVWAGKGKVMARGDVSVGEYFFQVESIPRMVHMNGVIKWALGSK